MNMKYVWKDGEISVLCEECAEEWDDKLDYTISQTDEPCGECGC